MKKKGLDGEKVNRQSLTQEQGFAELSRRENHVLHWIVEGKRDAEIAILLGISRRTVQKHVQKILSKLQVENRTAAACLAVRYSASTGSGDGVDRDSIHAD